MEYKTSKEMSILWGITPKRINVLAKEGRIRGAELIGNTWMIPSNSEKPSDKRYNANKKKGNFYRFPLFMCHPSGNKNFIASLSNEEKRCLIAEKKFHANKMMDAYDTFLSLYKNSEYAYIRINALYHLSFTNLLRQEFDEYRHFYDLFSKEIDLLSDKHKELILLKNDIQSLIRGNINLFSTLNQVKELNFDRASFLFALISLFNNNLSNIICGKGNKDLTPYELVTDSYLADDYPPIINILHIILGMTYFLLGDMENNKKHIRKAVEISYKHKTYNALCEYATYISGTLDPILDEYPNSFKEIIKEGTKLYIGAINGVARHFNGESIPTLLESDINYIGYAIKKMSNKEIAIDLNISEAAVSKKYLSLFEKFNVLGKEELVEKLSRSLSNPYLLGTK